ncbi:NACHT domain-containing protein [Streptomyces sp. DSM 41524]|uniref:NACHT domain-containing protein n=1 Tax=Streptomyces asiaticus subsp. ignotus TaxID=3098222 RepID=A0ABU7PYD2_9ACTN|nr:NACHT domain-containing protein [Streptomyces sp. DSM 41524]
MQSLETGEATSTAQENFARRRALLQGEPGSGKTYLIKTLAATQAQDFLNGNSPSLPILLQANQLTPSRREDVFAWISRQVNEQTGEPILEYLAMLQVAQEGGIHILIDDLDEIADLPPNVLATENITQLAQKHPILPLTATARNISKIPASISTTLSHWTILPFGEAELRALQDSQLGHHRPTAQVNSSRLLEESSGNPLILHLLLTYATEKEFKLPASRTKLFEDITHAIFLRERERTLAHPSVGTLDKGHEIIAAALAMNNLPHLPAELIRPLLTSDAEWGLTEQDTDRFVTYALERVGILNSPSEGRIGFTHRVFYEYYVGRILARRVATSEIFLPDGLDQSLIFAAGLAANPIPIIAFAYKRRALKLAAACCQELENPANAREHLANLVLADLGPHFQPVLRSLLPTSSTSTQEQRGGEPGVTGSDFYVKLREQWASLPRKGAPSTERGTSLETFAKDLFGAHFKVVKVRRHHRVGEIDLVCEMERVDPFWVYHGGDVWVECKNTENKATTEQVNTFIGKLVGSRYKLGFFLSASGFTRDAMKRMGEAAAGSASPLVVPITGEDIQQLINDRTEISQFFKESVRKIA